MAALSRMTREDVAAHVAHELASYQSVGGPGLVGRPWPPERVAGEIETLRAALVPPRRAMLHVEAWAGEASRTTDAWVVAEAADGTVVAFEPGAGTFWLVEDHGPAGLTAYGVFGDLVGTFMAR
jgi:hypothetical protein